MKTPPYRIDTKRLILRCFHPKDALILQKSINQSIEHLKPFMPWAHLEPTDLDTKIQLLRRFRAQFDEDKDYIYSIWDINEREILGVIGLHPRIGPGGCEIGYWINVNHTRKGLTTEAVRALVKIGFEICELDRIEIHFDPKNQKSSGIPQNLGFAHEASLKRRFPDENGNLQDKEIYSLFKENYQKQAYHDAIITAIDAGGRKVV